MRRLIVLLTLTCIVVDQTKKGTFWLTTCAGQDGNGQVVFEEKILKGQAVDYKPFIVAQDDVIHGRILGIGDAPPQKAIAEPATDVGKTPS